MFGNVDVKENSPKFHYVMYNILSHKFIYKQNGIPRRQSHFINDTRDCGVDYKVHTNINSILHAQTIYDLDI